jgi:hypothetical protein
MTASGVRYRAGGAMKPNRRTLKYGWRCFSRPGIEASGVPLVGECAVQLSPL